MRKIRYIIFLKDVLILAVTCFGGPQVHLVLFLERFVYKRGYITEEELLELQALCQVLPGPTSTQTITALGFKIGGPGLAYLTLLVWALPAVLIMTAAAIGIFYLEQQQISLRFTRFIEPMAIGFLAFGGFKIGQKVIEKRVDWLILAVSAITAYIFQSPWVTPIVIILGGLTTAFGYKKQPTMVKSTFQIQWANFFLWVGVFVLAAALGAITYSLPVRLFENFYRNGSLVFGGGQVLNPILYTEFVEFKQYLSRQEFLSGMALAQVIPGPVFSIASFIGALSMRTQGLLGQLLGSLSATLGIFLPGTFLIFFVYRFWNELKKYRGVRASLEGINAASVGLTASATVRMFIPTATDGWAIVTVLGTLLLLFYTKIPPYLIILGGILLGLLL
ncbi:MAG: chromate efflux transporter [Runella slithyformis]|nr:MAG: chromate efflux transporter [Runella slithyformis]TAF29595.1 MAG: chromate efflux transporter [Runella slithyformis]TAF48430.1 MAG: chromate efflux transporter [Runella slithyformis]TAF83012.1 MAG: chromate efflux transporter [Runella slithyformis]